MGDIGKTRPHPSGEDKVREWTVPVAVFDTKGNKYEVDTIYEDEGFLCIEIKVDNAD